MGYLAYMTGQEVKDVVSEGKEIRIHRFIRKTSRILLLKTSCQNLYNYSIQLKMFRSCLWKPINDHSEFNRNLIHAFCLSNFIMNCIE